MGFLPTGLGLRPSTLLSFQRTFRDAFFLGVRETEPRGPPSDPPRRGRYSEPPCLEGGKGGRGEEYQYDQILKTRLGIFCEGGLHRRRDGEPTSCSGQLCVPFATFHIIRKVLFHFLQVKSEKTGGRTERPCPV